MFVESGLGIQETSGGVQNSKIMNEYFLYDIFYKYKLNCGRIISSHKKSPTGQICVWNANIIIKSSGKIWFGDLNITKEGDTLKEIAKEIGEPLYVLRESDCRFNTENDNIDLLITKSVWNTDMETTGLYS